MKRANNICMAMVVLLLAACTKDSAEVPVTEEVPNMACVNICIEVDKGEIEVGEEEPAITAFVRTPSLQTSSSLSGGNEEAASICYTVPPVWEESAPTDSSTTRSTNAASVKETVIKDLWALQYDHQGNLVGKPVYKDGLEGKTQVTLMLTQTATGMKHTVYFIANTGSNVLFTANNVPTVSRLEAIAHQFPTEADVTRNGVLLMSGLYNGELRANTSIATGIVMTRIAAKVVFTYDAAGFRDGAFKVLSVQMKNVAAKSAYIFPATLPACYPVGGVDTHVDYSTESAPSATTGTYTWYIPENVRGSNPGIVWEGDKCAANAPMGQSPYATFVEIKGEAVLADGSQKNIIYMFYLGKDMTDYSLRRNKVYTLNANLLGVDENDQRIVVDVSTPILSATGIVDNIKGTMATAHATIVSDGGDGVTTKGFYLSDKVGFEPTDAGVRTFISNTPLSRSLKAATPWAVETRAAFVPVSFEANLTGLRSKTSYYVRPFAVNSFGTTVGEPMTFITSGAPSITTGIVSEVITTTAKVAYILTDGGASAVSATGIVYSTAFNFDPASSSGVTRVKASGSPVTLGTSPNPTLTENTLYYARAFATNGDGTTYGDQVSFKTLSTPVFGAITLIDVQGSYVQASGSASILSPATLTDRGVMWKTGDFSVPSQGNPGKASSISGNNYVTRLSDMHPGNTWYLYAYGTAGGYTFYGTTKYSHALVPTPGDVIFEKVEGTKVTVRGNAPVGAGSGTVTERGYKWSASSGFDPVAGGTNVVPSGTGDYPWQNLGNVSAFYLRPFAKNSNGHMTYANQVSNAVIPVSPATTFPARNLAKGEVTLEVTTQTTGTGAVITDRGVKYSTTNGFDPLISGTWARPGTVKSAAPYTFSISGLPPTIYYIRSYICNSLGNTYYSAQSAFDMRTSFSISSSTAPSEIPQAGDTYYIDVTSNTSWSTSCSARVSASPASYSITDAGTKTVRVAITVTQATDWSTSESSTHDVSVTFTTEGMTTHTDTWERPQEDKYPADCWRKPLNTGRYIEKYSQEGSENWTDYHERGYCTNKGGLCVSRSEFDFLYSNKSYYSDFRNSRYWTDSPKLSGAYCFDFNNGTETQEARRDKHWVRCTFNND